MLKQNSKVRKLILDNQEYVLVARAHWDAITKSQAASTFRQKKRSGSYTISDVRRSLANKVASRRNAAGMTQRELARLAGVRVETISRLENGLHMPGAKTFAKLERALARRASRTVAG